MNKVITITSVTLSFVFVFAVIIVSNLYTMDLGATPPQFPGYEVHRHLGKGKYHVVSLGLNIGSRSPSYGRPAEISGRSVPDLDALAYFEKNAERDGAANATIAQYFMTHPDSAPGFMKSRESTSLRGRAATQARFFYFWGTIYKKVSEVGKEPTYAVMYVLWDDRENKWSSGLKDLEPTRSVGWGRHKITRNIFEKNEYHVFLR